MLPVLARVQPTNPKILIEKVGAMTPVFDAIVDKELKDDIASARALKRDILAVESNHFAESSESVLDPRSVAARVLQQALGPDVFAMPTRRLAKFGTVAQLFNGLLLSQEVDSVLHGHPAFVRSDGLAGVHVDDEVVTLVELVEQGLEGPDVGLGILAQSVRLLEHLPVENLHTLKLDF